MVAPDRHRYSDNPGLGARWRGGIALAVLGLEAGLALLVLRGLGGVLPLADRAEPPRWQLTPAITLPPDQPSPPPPDRATPQHEAEGAQGATGRKARATQIVAAPPRLAVPSPPAAPVAGTGDATRSGAGAQGDGTGGAGAGAGPGNGGSGSGSGGRYVVNGPVKLAGDLTEADYPREGRAARLGTRVVIVLTVGTDGRASACRVHQHSGDPAADAITCRLAQERFRFRPAQDQNGNAITADYGWQQRFFYKP